MKKPESTRLTLPGLVVVYLYSTRSHAGFHLPYRTGARVGLGFRTAQAKIQTPLLFTIACLVSNLTIDGRVS